LGATVAYGRLGQIDLMLGCYVCAWAGLRLAERTSTQDMLITETGLFIFILAGYMWDS
jgi:hypothetical protein